MLITGTVYQAVRDRENREVNREKRQVRSSGVSWRAWLCMMRPRTRLVGKHLKSYRVAGAGRTQGALRSEEWYSTTNEVHTTRARQSDSASYAVAENYYGIFHAEAVRVGVACEVQGHDWSGTVTGCIAMCPRAR